MLKSLGKFFISALNFLLPLRSNFEIVRQLDEKAISLLPKAPDVADADWIHSLFHYKNRSVRAIIWELKYKGNSLPLQIIGRLLYEEIIAFISDIVLFDAKAEFLLIPIPISQEKRIERGYNQSEYIARAILENDVERVLLYSPQWFSKIRDTRTQNKSQTRSERLTNLLGCFEADPRVEGKYVILIDDVVTTGSTLSEARRTLLEGGARDVMGFTIAH